MFFQIYLYICEKCYNDRKGKDDTMEQHIEHFASCLVNSGFFKTVKTGHPKESNKNKIYATWQNGLVEFIWRSFAWEIRGSLSEKAISMYEELTAFLPEHTILALDQGIQEEPYVFFSRGEKANIIKKILTNIPFIAGTNFLTMKANWFLDGIPVTIDAEQGHVYLSVFGEDMTITSMEEWEQVLQRIIHKRDELVALRNECNPYIETWVNTYIKPLMKDCNGSPFIFRYDMNKQQYIVKWKEPLFWTVRSFSFKDGEDWKKSRRLPLIQGELWLNAVAMDQLKQLDPYMFLSHVDKENAVHFLNKKSKGNRSIYKRQEKGMLYRFSTLDFKLECNISSGIPVYEQEEGIRKQITNSIRPYMLQKLFDTKKSSGFYFLLEISNGIFSENLRTRIHSYEYINTTKEESDRFFERYVKQTFGNAVYVAKGNLKNKEFSLPDETYTIQFSSQTGRSSYGRTYQCLIKKLL